MSLINIVSVGPAEVKQSKTGKSYSQVEVFYKDEKGGARAKKIMSFARDIYPVVSKASPGEQYDVTVEKKGDFWEWTAINKASGAVPAASGSTTSSPPSRTFPKSDETDRRIARSVALKAAVEYLATCASGKADKSVQAVLGLSVQFEEYLMKGAEAVAAAALAADAAAATVPFEDTDDDIPL